MRSGFTIDGASEIDPLVASGPRLPVKNLRPAIKSQRVLIVEDATLLMADMETGRIGPWENGPQIAVPMVSLAFSLDGLSLLQVQVLRDGHPTASDTTLVSVKSGSRVVDVVETTQGELVVRSDSQTLAAGPVGESPAVVVDISPIAQTDLRVSVRNAETLTATNAEVSLPSRDSLVLTVGGPRPRQMPAHVDVVKAAAPVTGVRRAASGARSKVGALKRRVL